MAFFLDTFYSKAVRLLYVLFLVIPAVLVARPPKDLVPDTLKAAKKIEKIRNKDIRYTDALKNPDNEKIKVYTVKALFKVQGRSKPVRDGKNLYKIEKGMVVEPFRLSESKRWVAVKIPETMIRVWLPRSALEEVDPKLFK